MDSLEGMVQILITNKRLLQILLKQSNNHKVKFNNPQDLNRIMKAMLKLLRLEILRRCHLETLRIC